MTRTFHARAFIALPTFITDQGPGGQMFARQQIADFYLAKGFGVTITEGTGYTAEWGAEATLIVETFVGGKAADDPKTFVAFDRATIDACAALNQQCALVHRERIDHLGATVQHAYLQNADTSQTDLS